MNWVLVYVLLSSGPGADSYISKEDCIDAMIELEVMTKKDLWSASCSGPDAEWIRSTRTVETVTP